MALAPNAVDFRNERRQVGCNIISDRCEMDGRDWSAIDHLTVRGMDVCSMTVCSMTVCGMIVQAHAITGSRYSRITITQECYISGSRYFRITQQHGQAGSATVVANKPYSSPNIVLPREGKMGNRGQGRFRLGESSV